MDEQYAKALLSKERAFLFLSIVIITTLLTGFPESLKIFVLGTAGTITGAVTVVQPVELKDYLVGLVIFAALMVFLMYLVHALRTPRTQTWYPKLTEEDEEDFDVTIDKDMDLDNNLERVNRELKNLRTAKEDSTERKKSKKITKVPDMREISLEYTLQKINAQLHGYKKPPMVLEAPAAKTEWDDHLEEVKLELAGVDTMKIKEAKVRKEMPSEKDIALRHESKRLQEELKASLSKAKNNSKPILVLEEPSKKKQWNEQLNNVNRELKGVDTMPIKKVKIREEMPLITKTSQTVEQKQLAKELQNLHKVLDEEQRKKTAYFVRRCIPASREWQLANIKKHLQKKGTAQNKEELAKIEQKLAKIY